MGSGPPRAQLQLALSSQTWGAQGFLEQLFCAQGVFLKDDFWPVVLRKGRVTWRRVR